MHYTIEFLRQALNIVPEEENDKMKLLEYYINDFVDIYIVNYDPDFR